MDSLKQRLTEILINNKIITQAELKKALKLQKQKGGLLKDILVNLGFASEKDLMAALSQGLGIPPISLSRFRIDPEILKLIPNDIARKYTIVPVSKVGNILTIATSDPLNVFAVDDLRAVTGFEIGTIIASQKDVQDVIDEHYSQDSRQAIEELMDDMKDEEIEIIQSGGGVEQVETDQLIKLVEEAPVVKLTNTVLQNAIKARASDILIEPMEDSLRIRFRIDGVLKEFESVPINMRDSVVSRLKVMSELNIAERRLPQDGRFKLSVHDRVVDFRLSILPSSRGEKVALRVLDKSLAMLEIGKLGFEDDAVKILKNEILRPHGMMLVCGPTGSGKSTTLYSLLKYVHDPGKNLITVEDPVEYQIKGINQVSVRSDVGLTFSNSLRSILRQDPDVIMIGEIRDFETVDIAIKAALTGHLVLSTLHTTTACGSVARLLNMGVEPFLISGSLIAIVAQRLVRKLCPKCKEAYKVQDSILSKLRIEEKKVTFYRAKGCSQCMNTGYKGRVGLCEIFMMSPAVRALILKRARESQLKEVGRKEGMKTLRENGIQKVLRGITSLEEILRLTVADE